MPPRNNRKQRKNRRAGPPGNLPVEEHSRDVGMIPMIRVKGQIAPRKELKYQDVTRATYALDTTGSVTMLNGIAEGDDFTSRNSRSIIVKSVALRGFAFTQSSAGAATPIQKGRIMLVWDNAANGALATIGNILVAADSTAFPNVNYEKRFTILYDKSFVFGPYNAVVATSVGVADLTVHDVEALIKLDAPVQYNGTDATIASIQNGALLLVTCGTSAAGVGFGTSTLSTRVRFLENDSN